MRRGYCISANFIFFSVGISFYGLPENFLACGSLNCFSSTAVSYKSFALSPAREHEEQAAGRKLLQEHSPNRLGVVSPRPITSL
jgi:hypothetical protein